ncbi:hypothetical protein L218DRAFT_101107 [Marasmius fiardii PR-910]|nr:hypothetical protein L218DRAFT_101107 [Marasmius fiardii PR-910]
MELTFITEIGESFTIEIDPEQSISLEGRDLNNLGGKKVQELGIMDRAVLQLKRKIPSAVAGRCVSAFMGLLEIRKASFTLLFSGRPLNHDSEMMRLQLLGDPNLMNDLRRTQPELAEAAQNNPTRFAELLRQMRTRQDDAELARQREIERLNADPFDVEAQRRIEEAIRQEAVMENLEHAIEYSPESFGIVTMLYIDVEINGKPVKAFVDSGAQRTISEW